MDEPQRYPARRLNQPPKSPSPFPLQKRFLLWGLAVAVVTGAGLFQSALAGLSFFILFACLGGVWRRDETPIIAYCLAYQWLFIISGYLYQQVTGAYPGFDSLGNIDAAVYWSLIGLLVLVAGIRTSLFLLRKKIDSTRQTLQVTNPRYDVRRLFWLVIITYSISWFIEISPMEILFDAAQVIYRVLEFRTIFLFLLFLTIVEQKRGYSYGVIAFIYTTIPSFSSQMSAFSGSFLLVFIALLSQWRPWLESVKERRQNIRLVGVISGLSVLIFCMAVVWQGVVKETWRNKLTTGQVTGSPTDKAQAFVATVDDGLSRFDLTEALGSLAARTSSGPGYFSFVLMRVPESVPYENGTLTLRALQHTFLPRFIFPEKANLGGDSWLVIKYAGLHVAGEEQGTSIGLGYMPEAYIDFGTPGMYLPLFAYGLIIGLIYGGLLFFSPSYKLYIGAITIMLGQHFISYEGEMAKLLGGLVQSFIVFALMLRYLGPVLHRYLTGGALSLPFRKKALAPQPLNKWRRSADSQ
jgi:hypothetical protein